MLAALLSALFPSMARGATSAATSTAATSTEPARAGQTPAGRPAVKCQAAIEKAGTKFVGKKLRSLDTCAHGVLKCIQTKADADAKQQACVVKAGQKCAQASSGGFAKIAAAEDQLVATIRKYCEVEGLSPEDLRRIDGLGFDKLAADCPSLATVRDIAACIAVQHACRAEQMFQVQAPRARELIDEAVAAAGLTAPALTCLDHLGGGDNLDDPKRTGKLIVQCESTIMKAGTKLVSTKLRSLDKCVDAIFACVQTKAGVDRQECLAKAGTTCAKQFGKILAEASKVRPAVDKKCSPDPAALPAFYETALSVADGANLAAPTAECALVGADPATYAGYKVCLVDQHEARADALLRFQAPRADELLALVGCDLESLACGLPTATTGVLLEGDPDDPAVGALLDLPPVPAADGDIVNGLILTRLDVAIAADATIGQVNAALGAVGGGIVSMRAGLPAVTVTIPRQNGPAELRTLGDVLEAQPGIRLVLLPREAELTLAPPPPANTEANFGYLQKTHFPAAWNARTAAPGLCVNNKVTVIVADMFHRPIDVLYSDFATQVPGVTNLGIGSVAAADLGGHHGYDVLTTIAATLDATVPTGANPFPDCLDVKAVQIKGLSPYEISFAIDFALQASTGKAVVNASYAFGECGDPEVENVCTPANLRAPRALERAGWGAMARALMSSVADRVLVTSAAGNDANEQSAVVYPGAGQARVGSALNVAATADSAMSFVSETALWEPTVTCTTTPCLPSLTATPAEVIVLEALLDDLAQTSAPRASNVVLVGSIDDSFNTSDFSEPGADVFAVGEGIPTLLVGFPAQGTSFSAPQVAGLATYLWMLSPELRARPVSDTIAAIKANADSDGIINAYATVLSLDVPVAVTPATAPVRLAILDTNDDSHFDLTDLQAFHDAYVDEFGNVIEPSAQDFSRFDLNGDGFTGGSQTARFDLDPTDSTRFGAPNLTPDLVQPVGPFTATFDEPAVTDADALCFYAWSGLFEGSPPPNGLDPRIELLKDLCTFGGGVYEGTITWTHEEDFSGSNDIDTGNWNVVADATLAVQDDLSLTIAGGTVSYDANFLNVDDIAAGAQPCITEHTAEGVLTGYTGTLISAAGALSGFVAGTATFTPPECGQGGALAILFDGQVQATHVFEDGFLVEINFTRTVFVNLGDGMFSSDEFAGSLALTPTP